MCVYIHTVHTVYICVCVCVCVFGMFLFHLELTLSLFEVSNYVVIPLGVCVQLRAFDTKLRK